MDVRMKKHKSFLRNTLKHKLKLSEHRKSETTENLNKFKREIERDGGKIVAGTNVVKKTR